ncbi:MAG TPA: uroporphyrinogen-III synthase [Castellaniella sp.]|nr:uroporphyrinogen-III synthase [Castellaniella sp.]
MPLAILTRPAGRNERIAQQLQDQGLAVMLAPALALQPLDGPMSAPDDFQLVIFVSRQAVQQYFAHWDGRWPDGTWAAAVGQATAGALRDWVPAGQILAPSARTTQDSEALMALIRQQSIRPGRVLILRGDRGREWLSTQLGNEGWSVERRALYRRDPVLWTRAQCLAAAAARPCVLLLSSLDGLRAIAASFQFHDLPWPEVLQVVAIHERIGRQLQYVLDAATPARVSRSLPGVNYCAPDEQAIFQAILTASRLRC